MNPIAPKYGFGRFSEGNEIPWVGVVTDGMAVASLRDLATVVPNLPEPLCMNSILEDFHRITDVLDRCELADFLRGKSVSLDTLTVHSPIAPRQIICTGANYKKHVIDLVAAQGTGIDDVESTTIEERRQSATRRVEERAKSGEPYAFPKLVSALTGPYDQIFVPHEATQLDWELELGVVIGKECWQVDAEKALDHVAGYVMVNDLTRRELVYRHDMRAIGTDWLRSKSGPGFMPCGPFLVPRHYVPDPQKLQIDLEVNGRLMQSESTEDMLFNVASQIQYLSRYVRLLPGDLLATGSPAGNGMHHGVFLRPGDVMVGKISGLGVQRNQFVEEVK